MEEKRVKVSVVVWRIVLPLLALGTVAWIFCNSLTPAVQSSAQSESATGVFIAIIRVFYPEISSLTEEAYEKIHGVIRVLAHFAEFAYLGALLAWCWRAYTKKRAWLVLPCAGVLLIPIVDELLQSFTDGRAMEMTDLLVDWAGGILGVAFALATLAIGAKIKVKRSKKHGERELGDSTH